MYQVREYFLRKNPETPSPLSVISISSNSIKDSQSNFLQTPPTTSKLLVYFQTYFTITYYFCLSPFTIIYNSTSKSYTIHKTRLQNAVCGIIQFSILFQYSSHCRGLDINTLRSDPPNYFELANVLGTLAYFLILFPTLWSRQNEFLQIFNSVTNSFTSPGQNFSPNQNSIIGTLRMYLRPLILCSLFLGWATYSVVTGLVAFHKYGILNISKQYSSRAEFVYLLQPPRNCSGSCQQRSVFDQNGNGPLLICLTIWYIFIEFYIWLGSYFCDLLFLVSAIFVRGIVRDFVKCLHEEGTSAVMALAQYLCLKKIFKKLNFAVGPLVLCVVVSALPYYASNIETVFGSTDGIRSLRISFYCLIFFLSLVIASDGNLKICELKDWLLEEGRGASIPQSSLILMINELNTFGLNGYGFFTITFGFFGTILSVLLTYSFIIVQFHSSTLEPSSNY